jgi:hypothetical protein
MSHIKELADQQHPKDDRTRTLIKHMKQQLGKVELLVERSEMARQQLQANRPEIGDEPITRVHFEHQMHLSHKVPWCEYEQGSGATLDFTWLSTASGWW